MTWKIEATGHLDYGTIDDPSVGVGYETFVLDEFRRFIERVQAYGTEGRSRCANIVFVGSGIGVQDARPEKIGTWNSDSPNRPDADYWRRQGEAGPLS